MMAITTTEQTAPALMVRQADTAIAELKQRQAAIAKPMQDAHTELAAIQQSAAARAEMLHAARTACDHADNEHSQAVSYAVLASETINERRAVQAVAAAKKALNDARRELIRLEHETTEADQASTRREQEIQQEIHRLQSEQEEIEAKLRNVERGRMQAHAELGDFTHTVILAAYIEHQARIDAIRRQLIDAQAEFHTFYESSLVELAGWPALRKDIARLVAPEDATSRMLDATAIYVAAIMREVSRIEELPPSLKQRGFTIWENVIVGSGEIFASHQRPQTLKAHSERLHRLIEAYREHLARTQR